MVTRKSSPPRSKPLPAATSAKALAGVPVRELLRLDNQLCFALYSASLTMTKVYKPLLKSLGLTYPQYLAMLVLWERDGVMVSELGERLFLDSGTLTPLLKRMEAQGLLRRERSAQDERQVLVYLTPAGAKLKQRAQEVPPEILRASQCTLGEVGELTRRVQKLRGGLEQSVAAD